MEHLIEECKAGVMRYVILLLLLFAGCTHAAKKPCYSVDFEECQKDDTDSTNGKKVMRPSSEE